MERDHLQHEDRDGLRVLRAGLAGVPRHARVQLDGARGEADPLPGAEGRRVHAQEEVLAPGLEAAELAADEGRPGGVQSEG